MGKLSEQTLRLREWHVAPGGKLVINLTQPPREEDLPRLHDAVNAFVGSLAARSEAQPSGYDGLAERDEMLSWLDVSIVRLNGCHDLGEVNLRNKYIRLRALLAAPSTRLHEGQAT